MENPEDARPEKSERKPFKLSGLFKRKSENPDEPPKDPTELTFQEILEKELGIIKVYDYAINNSVDLIFQSSLMDKYHQELIYPLIGDDQAPENADGGRLFLREEYERLQVGQKVNEIVEAAESVAQDNRIKHSSQKLNSRLSAGIMVVSMALYFGLMAINSLRQYQTQIMIPLFLVICLAPQLTKRLVSKKYNTFQQEHQEEILRLQQPYLADVRTFIQDVIDDVRDRLISQNVALEKIQFVLFSEGYRNVRFVRNQGGQRGAPLQSIYQFDYPEGMGPSGQSMYGKSGIPEDDSNDFFIFLKSAQYDEEGRLAGFSQENPPKEDYKLPEALLNASEFSPVDDPDLVIPDFETYDKVECECGSPVMLKEMKTSRSALHDEFEFYLVIGHKCPSCGKNPYVLINSPGNAEIPKGLFKIFE